MDLVLDGSGPRYAQLVRALRHAIASGRLPGGTRLPASRDLARDLGVSRTTVVAAFDQLRAEGLLTGRVGSGSYVNAPASASQRPPRPRRPVLPQSAYSRRARELHDPEDLGAHRLPGMRHAFQYALPLVNATLNSAWIRELARSAPYVRPNYPMPQGLPSLREAICTHVTRTRGLQCTPQDIMVVGGAQQAISLAARVLVDPGDDVVMEEPQYFGTRKILQMHGANIVGVPVDADGMQTHRLPDRPAKLVCLTPSHQFPTGAVLSMARRLDALEYARQSGGWVLEDDYDGEFRQDAQPVPALQSLDRDGRVVYVGSFSKTLFPSMRLGYIVMPPGLHDDFLAAKWAADFATAPLEQAALAQLIATGAYERHLRAASKRLAERRNALCDALARQCGHRVVIRPSHAGMHVLAEVTGLSAADGMQLIRHARERGLGLYSAAVCYLAPPDRCELLMGYGAMSTRETRDAVALFAECLDSWGVQMQRPALRLAHSR